MYSFILVNIIEKLPIKFYLKSRFLFIDVWCLNNDGSTIHFNQTIQIHASSDGSSPKKSSQGRAQALNVKLGPGSSLSPSLKAGPRAGPGGLAGLSI